MTTVFVSHHNSDKALLAQVKEWMGRYGITLFLAHDDIPVGANDLEAIRENIDSHRLFFAYGSKATMQSPACNQEIGMALALVDKPTIWALQKDSRPWGVMPPQQGIPIGDGETEAGELFYNLFRAIEKHTQADTQKQDALTSASIDAFVVSRQDSRDNRIITLVPDGEEYGLGGFEQHPTRFFIRSAGVDLGTADIVFKGQSVGQKTSGFLPEKFPFLGRDYLSRIQYNESSSEQRQKALTCLLHDAEGDAEYARNWGDKHSLENILFSDDKDALERLLSPQQVSVFDAAKPNFEDTPF